MVEQKFDAGIRLGEQVEKDMIAVRISQDMQIVVVASPDYLSRNPAPHTIQDLADHQCIGLRLPTYDNLMLWEFEQDGQPIKAHVQGQCIFNTGTPILRAALAGHGLAYLPSDMAEPHLATGALISVLAPYCPRFPGYHLYYPSRRQNSPTFRLFLDAVRLQA
ncbi:LysR substrate-binding domain-containing protein [Aeromonas media]|uniref:LysR substrate-binding domain-containing protein n=1 Tax=Aeromonas media TaxID=651 RepID=UPI003D08B81F